MSSFLMLGLFPNLSTAQVIDETLPSAVSEPVLPSLAPDASAMEDNTDEEAVPVAVDMRTPVQKQIESMSLEEKVGQLFIIGFPQSEIDDKLRKHIEKYHFSNFLLFKRNLKSPSQIESLTANLKKITSVSADFPALIALDQEGGFVSRLKIKPRQPHPAVLGLSKNFELSKRLGKEVGLQLKKLGFNMNLAPVLDIASLKKDSFIRLRSYGGDPKLAAEHGNAYSQGLLDAGVLPTAKHFPGLGPIQSDPHSASIVRNDSLKQLTSIDFSPFKKFSQLGAPSAVMLSHIIYPSLDDSGHPASFSKKIIQTWLRESIQFEGIVMTDDLHMKASTDSYQLGEGAIKTLEAGSDVVMMSWSFKEQEKTYLAVLKAYKNKKLDLNELDKKVSRVLTAKKYIHDHVDARDDEDVPSVPLRKMASDVDFESDEFRKINLEIFADQLEKIVLPKSKSVCFYTGNSALQDSFKKTRWSNLKHFSVKTKTSSTVLKTSLETNKCGLNFITLENRQDLIRIAGLSAATRRSTILVNLGLSSLFRWAHGFKDMIHYFGELNPEADQLKMYFANYLQNAKKNEKINATYEQPDQSLLELAPTHEFESQSSRLIESQSPTSSQLE